METDLAAAAMHDENCAYEEGGRPCLKYSTDGTSLGAWIAHTMGTTDEEQIVRDPLHKNWPAYRSNVEAEQADWDSDEPEDG